METTSKIQKIRDRIQKDLDRANTRFSTETGAMQTVIGGEILGLESALRTIDLEMEFSS